MPHAVVIGAGFGGIAAALRLRAKGYEVTLIEKHDQLGGRAMTIKRDGFVFDMGPTVLTAPFLFDELFELFGKKREDYVKFVPLYPWYRVLFHDGRFFDYGGTLEQTLDQIRKFNPPDCDGYLRFLEQSRRIFEVGFVQLGDKPFLDVMSMIRCAPQMLKLGAWRTVWQMASKYIKHDLLRRVFSFQPLLVGGNPYNTTSIYSLIHFLEREYGVHFAMGGTGKIIEALRKLMIEEGIKIRLGNEVETIQIKSSIRFRGTIPSDGEIDTSIEGLRKKLNEGKFVPRVTSIKIASADRISIEGSNDDIVVCNADAPFAYHSLTKSEHSELRWTPKKLAKLKFSMGLFVLYFGTTKKYPDIQHHTIILGKEYKSLLHEMFDLKQLEMKDFSIYLHRPTATDPSMAPEACDAFYALVPVPNLQGKTDWKTMGPKYRDLVVEYLERKCLPGLRESITSESYVTPEFYRDQLNTLHGTGFSIQPTFDQSAYFRFHNKSEDIENLYFVGAGTHPGAGMPGVLCSAKVLEHLIPDAPKVEPRLD